MGLYELLVISAIRVASLKELNSDNSFYLVAGKCTAVAVLEISAR